MRLDPLTRADAGPLLLAANEDRSSYAFTWAPGMQDEMEADVRAALDQQSSGERSRSSCAGRRTRRSSA